MESDNYGFAVDPVIGNKNLFEAIGGEDDFFGAMEGHIDHGDYFESSDMYYDPDDMYSMDREDMYMDGDDMYMNPEELLAKMSVQERDELLRRYQYYHHDEISEDTAGVLNDEYSYYDDYEYYDQDQYPGYYDDEYSRISLTDLCDQCIFPTLSQAFHTLYPLLGLCLVTRLSSYLISEVFHGAWGFGRRLQHVISAICGVISLYMFFEETLTYLIMLAILAYSLLYLTRLKCTDWSGKTVAFITVVYLLTCELFVVPQVQWHRIRGAQMVLAMKIISIAFDLDSKIISQLPGPLEYAGYTFNVGTVIFGPWVSFTEYSNSLQYKERKMTFYWIAKCMSSGLLCLICVAISTCITHWVFLDEEAFIWLLAYKDAQSFRFSHYFISYASELTATLCALGATRVNGDLRWDLTVARPLHIEAPRSLVEVVSNWNLPMHYWLKTYVFKTARPLGNFAAILLTYAASSILHGLNFQLAAVLLSLGFYSYIEYVLRKWLSRVYDACVQAKACKEHCDHVYSRTNVYVYCVNLLLGFLTVFHLAYLGVMFDSSQEQEEGYTMSHTLEKWSILSYASHWFALATYIFYLLI